MGDSDIAARMRKWAEVLKIPSGSFVNEDCTEAANEIARLTAENDRMRTERSNLLGSARHQKARVDALTARVKELEEALQRIASTPDYRLPKPQDIARAALNPERTE